MTETLLDRIREALDEDERVAREACDNDSGEWFMGRKWNVDRAEELWPGEEDEEHALVVFGNIKDQSLHIERFNPARVLRQVAAMRKVLELHSRTSHGECNGCGLESADDYAVTDVNHCPTLLALAEAYGLDREDAPNG